MTAAVIDPAAGALAPTGAGDWRNDTTVMALPSGNVARLRRPQLFTWLAEGEIPNPLRAAVVEIAGEDTSGEVVTPEARARALFWIVARCFVDPVVVTDVDAGPGELHIRDIDDADKFRVVEWAMGEVAAMAGFRAGPAGALGGGDGAGVRDEAQRDAGRQ